MAEVLAHQCGGLQHPEHEGGRMEPQHPTSSGRKLAFIGELSGNAHHPLVVDATNQSCRLSRIGSLHAQWGQLHNVLYNRQSGAAPPADSGESAIGTILWFDAEDRYRSYGQL